MHDLFDLLGIKGPVVAAGLAGGVLRALSRHRYKLREMVASPICGALAAAYLTLPVVIVFQGNRPADPRSGRRHHHARRRFPYWRQRHVDLRHPLRCGRAKVQGGGQGGVTRASMAFRLDESQRQCPP